MSTDNPKPQKGKKTAVDWHEIKQRMQAADAAIERIWAPDQAETKRVLKERARVLSQEPVSGEVAGYLEVVEFLLAYETYAIESRFVREVYPLENLTPLPCTPAYVLGIVNVRGEMFSVVDIKKFFELPEKGLTDLNKLIVLDAGDMRFGILADAIAGVRHIPLAGIQPSLPTLTGIREAYLKGVTPEHTVILDAEKLLADEKMIVQEQVAG